MKRTGEKLKSNAGITLVALVVTIIVLVILASISIGAVFSEKGIIQQAKDAKKTHEDARRLEEENLNDLLGEYKNSMDGTGGSGSGGGGTTTPTPEVPKAPNTPPVIETATVNRTASEMSIIVKATDVDGDNLTYTIEWGTDTNYGNTTTPVRGNCNEDQTILLEGVTQYQPVFWLAKAEDGEAMSNAVTRKQLLLRAETAGSITCPNCNGATTTCTRCGGSSANLHEVTVGEVTDESLWNVYAYEGGVCARCGQEGTAGYYKINWIYMPSLRQLVSVIQLGSWGKLQYGCLPMRELPQLF